MDTPDVPRIRTLKPEHRGHRKIARLTDGAYRAWVGLINEVDDDGRVAYDADCLNAVIFVLRRKTRRQFLAIIEELSAARLLVLYESGGQAYLALHDFTAHQPSDKYHYRRSTIPAPETGTPVSLTGDSREALVSLGTGNGTGKEPGTGNREVSRAERRETACRLVDFLNAKAGRSFRKQEPTLEPIMARLADGATEANCRGVIARKVREWASDPKMAKYLRPETLFNRTKFESYLGERTPEATHGDLPAV